MKDARLGGKRAQFSLHENVIETVIDRELK